MEIISNPSQVDIKKAAQALKDGHLVAFPTETVYGLGADATNEKAVSRIYSVKARPTDHPLIVHISSINQLSKWAIDLPEYAIKLARKYWPGPITLILKRSEFAKNFITGGQENVGVRVPSHPVALALLSEFEKLGGLGIAAPSANKFGAVSPTSTEAVVDEISEYCTAEDLILDGGKPQVGIESSIIDCTDIYPKILRLGATTQEMIIATTGLETTIRTNTSNIRVSGILKRHYSPKAQLVISNNASKGEGFLALSTEPTPAGAIRLASPNSVNEFAQQMYEAIRKGDLLGLKKIIVSPPEGNGIASAIRDRLIRATTSE
jgi:L-threonylcarbamoyladenylate synthase